MQETKHPDDQQRRASSPRNVRGETWVLPCSVSVLWVPGGAQGTITSLASHVHEIDSEAKGKTAI